jgi:pyridoxine kinase
MNVLSIQSRVAYGHVGNAAATFPMQRLGHEVWPVDTTLLSNHLGYGTWAGRMLDATEVATILDGLSRLDVPAECDAVLSGFLGEAETAAVVAEAVARVKAARPDALYACDPVMGDRDGMYVRPAVPAAFAETLLPIADVALPNWYELGWLTGAMPRRLEEVLAAMAAVRALGPGVVVATGVRHAELPEAEIAVLAGDGAATWMATTPLLAAPVAGAGDCFSSLFLGHYLRRRDLPAALGAATSAMFTVLETTERLGTRELAIIAAQAELDPAPPRFAARRIG